MTTAHDFLMTCPGDQIARMRIVWKAVAAAVVSSRHDRTQLPTNKYKPKAN